MANHTPLPYLQRAEARLNFRIQEENSQRNIQEIIETDDAESRAWHQERRLACYYAVGTCQVFATARFKAEAERELREEATERAWRQAAQELAQPLGNNRRSRPY